MVATMFKELDTTVFGENPVRTRIQSCIINQQTGEMFYIANGLVILPNCNEYLTDRSPKCVRIDGQDFPFANDELTYNRAPWETDVNEHIVIRTSETGLQVVAVCDSHGYYYFNTLLFPEA